MSHRLLSDIQQKLTEAKVEKDIEKARMTTLFDHSRECISTLRGIVSDIKELVFISEASSAACLSTDGLTMVRFTIRVCNVEYYVYIGSPTLCAVLPGTRPNSFSNGTVQLHEAITGVVDYVCSELKAPILSAANEYVKRSSLY